jgi:hypothetical protein
MTRRRFTTGYILGVVVAGTSLLYLDAVGVFIYFGYVPAALLVLGVVLGGVFAAGKVPRLSRVDVMAFGVATLGLIAVVVVCPFLPTSQRKAFYLAATSVKAGMSWEEAQRRMATYPIFEQQAGAVTFLQRSSRDTVDTAVVRLTSDGETVAAVEYSAD